MSAGEREELVAPPYCPTWTPGRGCVCGDDAELADALQLALELQERRLTLAGPSPAEKTFERADALIESAGFLRGLWSRGTGGWIALVVVFVALLTLLGTVGISGW